jgi:hypothetical protein
MSIASSALDIDSTIRDLYGQIQSKARNLHPAIFPSQFLSRSISDLCTTEFQRERAMEYLEINSFDENTTFETVIDYPQRKIFISKLRKSNPLDQKIQSLEYMMRLFILGSKEEIKILSYRFLHANGYDSTSSLDNADLLQEVCTMAYTIKVAIR